MSAPHRPLDDPHRGDRLRVLVATHLFPVPDGPLKGPWVAEQVDALQTHADVTVLAVSQHARKGSETRASGVRVEYRRTATPFGHGRAGLLASTARYARALRGHLTDHEGAYDLVHAHFGFPDAVVAEGASRAHGLPLVVTLHGDDALSVLPRADALGSLVRGAVRSAARTVCVSAAMERAVREAEPAARTVVVPNGYDDGLFRVSDVPREGLLFVGLLTPVKNLHVLLEAFATRAGDIPGRLTIAGDGPLRGELEAAARRLGVADRVRFAGLASRPEVAALMARARALVLPSASEGWPLVVCEALASGTPVVASRVGGIPEIVTSPDAGLLVEPGDVSGLGAALAEAAGRTWDPASVAAANGARPIRAQAAVLADVYREVVAS